MRKLAATYLLAIGFSFAWSANGAELTGAVGSTSQSGMTYRLGASFAWDQSWFQTETGHLTGYWDTGYTYWAAGTEGSAGSSVSIAPVFLYEFAGEVVRPFVEIGVGVSAFSSTHIGEQDLGSAFNFEDRIGVGLGFKSGLKAGLRVIHYSNAGIKEPNDGIESFSLFLSQPL
ncbi:acyloxyacyl hydrolase [Pseudomonas syringae]|uniref:acyloxyacyl hydrolase n=1 Tax=Pseudomonas syringae TaxID=317 RepID=UPI000BB61643|nr:acyloxyacyl hydrolase [Pseudomonas syringae]MDU8500273.1 acyloxyacyl hydrolase [Pseudomonas syringae]PBP72046.1 acyloxyacyl hydrolase [Pseudomonas syringae]